MTFEGEKGRIYVNRGKIAGKPIEEQDADPALKEKTMNDVKALFKGNLAKLGDHMGNFFEGFKHNLPVISDVESQHRTASVCHLGNISIRLGRKIQWDPEKQEIVGDSRGQCDAEARAAGLPTNFVERATPSSRRSFTNNTRPSGTSGNSRTARVIDHESRLLLNRRQFVQNNGRPGGCREPAVLVQRACSRPTNRKTIGRFSACIGVARARDGASPNGPRRTAPTSWRCATSFGHPCRMRPRPSTFEKAEMYEDYRKLLERKDIEAVTIGTPDHWHTTIALAALDAGKHVYCEKPLTLTIDEGKQLVAAVKRTGKTFQVGTQQRGDQYTLFGRAVATARSGQLGKIKKVTVRLPDHHLAARAFRGRAGSRGLNWEFWQGQAPAVEYVPERCHYTFRWWWEYSGGLLTDWGAHHWTSPNGC